jgi:hypothetical protein
LILSRNIFSVSEGSDSYFHQTLKLSSNTGFAKSVCFDLLSIFIGYPAKLN